MKSLISSSLERPSLVTHFFDAESWQIDALKKRELNMLTLSREEYELILKKGKFNDALLIGFREDYHEESAGQGECGFFAYRSDGRISYSSYGQKQTLDPQNERDWSKASSMHPIHIRFFLGPIFYPCTETISPTDLKYFIQEMGLNHFNPHNSLDENLKEYWRRRYRREFLDEGQVYLFCGRAR